MGKRELSRRDFIATGAAAATAVSGFPFVRPAEAKPSPIKIGVVGAGGRGTGACGNALVADSAVELVAMAEIGRDRVDQSLSALQQSPTLQGDEYQKRIKVTEDTIFVGPDAFKELMALDLDYVILATPPGFRPLHYAEAVKRGLHVFAEKPVATDPVGCRAIRAGAEKAKQKGLSVVVGLNARHDVDVMETVKRIHDGALGEITSGSIHRMGKGLWHRGNEPKWSPMEYQMRNWYYFCWLSGDQIVEMVVHQIDLMNWAMGAVPVRALAQGGRLQRTDPKYGNIFDHMTVDYEYPGGVKVNLMCRQWNNCAGKNANRVVGKLGESDSRRTILGANPFELPDRRGGGIPDRSRRERFQHDRLHNPLVYEHVELIESIRKENARNDMLDFAIDSTLTAIMGRESAYTGIEVTWDEISKSDLNLFPESYQFGAAPERAVALPGFPRPV